MKKNVIIIAEAGVNHNGDIATAKKLIDVAVNVGVDYVKFQTFKAETIVSPIAKKAVYQSKNMEDGDVSQFQMLKKLELNFNDYKQLLKECDAQKIDFLSTPYNKEDVENLKTIIEMTYQKMMDNEVKLEG